MSDLKGIMEQNLENRRSRRIQTTTPRVDLLKEWTVPMGDPDTEEKIAKMNNGEVVEELGWSQNPGYYNGRVSPNGLYGTLVVGEFSEFLKKFTGGRVKIDPEELKNMEKDEMIEVFGNLIDNTVVSLPKEEAEEMVDTLKKKFPVEYGYLALQAKKVLDGEKEVKEESSSLIDKIKEKDPSVYEHLINRQNSIEQEVKRRKAEKR